MVNFSITFGPSIVPNLPSSGLTSVNVARAALEIGFCQRAIKGRSSERLLLTPIPLEL
jgi:hypothetical protein